MLQAALRQFFLSRAHHISDQATYWIAYSGGLDSHVLLSLCHSLRNELSLNFRVIHVHHGLSPHADKWAQHCARVCEALHLDLTVKRVQLHLQDGESLEAKARDARYQVFAELMQAGDVLLTAHQQDDQAETYLLQLLRGAGPKGLAAMPVLKPFAKGSHARPLLNFSRGELEAYANTQQLQWISDESNHNTQLSRNYIRHKIMPALVSRWPSAAGTIARSAAHCAESQKLLDEFACDACANVTGSHLHTLSVAKLLQQNGARQRLLLRTWIYQQGYPMPSAAKLNAILQDVLQAAWDRSPCVEWQGVEVRRYRDDLYLMPPFTAHDETRSYQWDLSAPLLLDGVGELRAHMLPGKGLRCDVANVSVRFRQGGEIVNLGKRGNHTLKNLFQEWHVLPWQRDRTPLFYVGDTLVAILDYFIHDDYAANESEMGWEIGLR